MSPLSKPSILIIDDDRNNLFVLSSILKSDCAVQAAKSGRYRSRIAVGLKPDLILLNVAMKDLSGFDVLRQLKEKEDTRDIPVIFVTDRANAEDEARAFALGAVDYITRPFHNTVIKVRVETQLTIVRQMRLIERSAHLDALTNLPNRRGYELRLAREWAGAIREGQPLGLIMLDVDRFKSYNTLYGQSQGDGLLQALARTLQTVLKRPGDFAARVGGEEFALILPNTALKGTLHIAEEIRAAVEALGLPHPDSPAVTVSLGAGSARPKRADNLADFVAGCDQALYEAQTTGWNRVCRFGSPDSSGSAG